jgi:GNAT superfamily N-acetyltransferase
MASKPGVGASTTNTDAAADEGSLRRRVSLEAVAIERVAAEGPRLIVVMAFHRRGANFLGPMPRGGFEEYAAAGGLILARVDETAVGYAMFAANDRYVRLVHLYIDEAWRRSGVARLLVEWISNEHRDRPGIRVSSRRDHERRDLWARLGFIRRGERPGRGHDREPLVIWWRGHGHPGLFEPSLDAILVRAAVDINIVRDRVETGRNGREASQALTADHMRDQLALFRMPTLDVEIDLLTDATTRMGATNDASEFVGVPIDDSRRRAVRAELKRARERAGTGARSISDHDIDYVSEAIGAGLDVLVTRDARLARHLGETARSHGLRLLRPEEVVVRIDELTRSAAYHPRAFEGTGLAIHLLKSGEQERLLHLASSDRHESRSMFTSRIAELTQRRCDRLIVEEPEGSIVACLFIQKVGSLLEVPLFRVRNDSLGPTIARQLLYYLRREALGRGAMALKLTDPHPSRSINAASEDDGYVWERGVATALVLDVAGRTDEIQASIRVAERASSISPSPMLRPPLTVREVAEVERTRWPAKILDSALPTFVLPIRQTFATTLLNVPEGLLDRSTDLGVSRTHVYFRSTRGGSPKAPGRLLWYLSKNRVAPAGLVATSQLDQVVEDDPDMLFERFEHLGVWSREDVRRAGSGGSAQALVFSNTEVFAEPVSYAETIRLIKAAPMSPRSVSSDVFALAYVGRARRG